MFRYQQVPVCDAPDTSDNTHNQRRNAATPLGYTYPLQPHSDPRQLYSASRVNFNPDSYVLGHSDDAQNQQRSAAAPLAYTYPYPPCSDPRQRHSSLRTELNYDNYAPLQVPDNYAPTSTVETLQTLGTVATLRSTEAAPVPTAEVVQFSQGPKDIPSNFDLFTRNICCLGLCIAWAVSIACLVLSSIVLAKSPLDAPSWLLGRAMFVGPSGFSWTPTPAKQPYQTDHIVFHVSRGLMLAVGLLFNIFLTYIFDTINLIHATSLRWELWSEHNLVFNSNPRLFSSTKRHGPNKWYSNIISAFALVLSYGGLNVLVSPVSVVAQLQSPDGVYFDLIPDFPGPHYGVDFSAWGLLGLGAGLFIQSIICTWCVFQRSHQVGTWSSNPLAVARACKVRRTRHNMTEDEKASNSRITDPSRPTVTGMQNSAVTMSTTQRSRSSSVYSLQSFIDRPFTHDSTPNSSGTPVACNIFGSGNSEHSLTSLVVCSLPQKHQPSAIFFIPKVNRITRVLWVITVLAIAWTITIGVISSRTGTATNQYVQDQAAPSNADSFMYWQLFGQVTIRYAYDMFSKRTEWVGLIVQTCVLAPPLLGMHYAEVIVQLIRDESIWRRATTPSGVSPDSIILLENARCWPCWVLFILKCAVPWTYSFAITSFTRVFMAIIPLSVFTFLFLVLTLFAEYTIRHEPRGPQPATYGNIGIICTLVEDWAQKKIFWGDKGEYAKGIRLAGTAGEPLPPLDKEAFYTGLRLDARVAPAGKTIDCVRGVLL